MSKENKWRDATIILIVFCIFLFVIGLIKQDKPLETYKFGDVEIFKQTFEDLASKMEDNQFYLCDINKNKCVTITRAIN